MYVSSAAVGAAWKVGQVPAQEAFKDAKAAVAAVGQQSIAVIVVVSIRSIRGDEGVITGL